MLVVVVDTAGLVLIVEEASFSGVGGREVRGEDSTVSFALGRRLVGVIGVGNWTGILNVLIDGVASEDADSRAREALLIFEVETFETEETDGLLLAAVTGVGRYTAVARVERGGESDNVRSTVSL